MRLALCIFVAMFALAATTAVIDDRVPVTRADGDWTLFKITVHADGKDMPSWMYAPKGTTDEAMKAQAIAQVDAQIAAEAADAAKAASMIPKADVDAALGKLATAGKIDAKYNTWDKVQTAATATAVTP